MWALAAALASATLAVYLPVLRNGFVSFDDHDYIVENVHVRTGLSWENTVWAMRSLEAANWHPLTWLSHQLDVQLFGLNAGGHHAVAALLHAINAVFLFLLLRRATGFTLRSLCVAALFAVHPLNVETVAWASERKSLLSFFLSLAAVAAYGWYAAAPGLRRYLAVVGCFAMALLAKPMAVTLPAVLLWLDYWPLERLPVPFQAKDGISFGRRFARLFVEKLPLLAMSAASAAITVVAQRNGKAFNTTGLLPLPLRLENALVSYTKYIFKIFWPNPLGYYYPHPAGRLTGLAVFASLLLLSAVSCLVWRYRERRYLLFGWGLFLVTLVPVIGIVQVGLQAMADRYAYIPMLGLLIMVVWGAGEACERLLLPAAFPATAAAVVLAALSLITLRQAGYWRDSVTLFTQGIRAVGFPDEHLETNLATALLDAGRQQEALRHFRIAESLNPASFTPHFDIGYALAQSGANADALPELQAAVKWAGTPDQKERALNSLAVAYLDLNRNEEAANAFEELLHWQPDSLAGHAGRGQALFNLRRYDDAAQEFAAAVRLQPAPALLLMLGKSLESAGDTRKASAAYQRALDANPSLIEARERLNHLQAQ